METMETKVNTTNETESAAHQTGMMDIKDFDYDLPEELIAQDPIEDRSSSRLLLLDKKTGKTQDKIFRDIIDELNPGDCLVINNTKVIPARLMGVKEDTGAHIEVLLLKREQDDVWEVLVKPGMKAKPGTIITFGDGRLKAEVLEVVEDGNRKIRFSYQGIFEEILDELGQMPLPPYITHQLKDKNRYQTVYAKYEGSAAAPTAGLHFTKDLLKKIEEKGVVIASVTLHVGLGTFRPVKVENVLEHHMHSEYYRIEPEEAEKINAAQLIQQRNSGFGKDFRTAQGTVNREFTDHICAGGQGHTASGVFVCTGRGTPLSKVTTHHDKNHIGAGLPADFFELIGVPVMKRIIFGNNCCNSHKNLQSFFFYINVTVQS